MLILSRRTGESVTIGDEVTVTVLGVKGSQVRLGFAAPPDVAVHREEINRRLRANRPAHRPSTAISLPAPMYRVVSPTITSTTPSRVRPRPAAAAFSLWPAGAASVRNVLASNEVESAPQLVRPPPHHALRCRPVGDTV